jgi:hypothetical protein
MLRPGFGYEFTKRPDGWTGLQRAYGLNVATLPRTMDLGLTYKALASGEIDLIAGNSTTPHRAAAPGHSRRRPPLLPAVRRRRRLARTDLDERCKGATAAIESLARASTTRPCAASTTRWTAASATSRVVRTVVTNN